jgi:hypothetical protein
MVVAKRTQRVTQRRIGRMRRRRFTGARMNLAAKPIPVHTARGQGVLPHQLQRLVEIARDVGRRLPHDQDRAHQKNRASLHASVSHCGCRRDALTFP